MNMTNSEAHFYLEELQRMMTQHRGIFSEEFVCANGMAIQALEQERKKGKWVFDYNNPYRRCKARCSICGKYSGIGGIRSNQLKPFCPNCGARMEEQE